MYLLIALLSYLLNSAALLLKLTGSQLVKKFPAFCATTSCARQLSLTWARSVHSKHKTINQTPFIFLLLLYGRSARHLPGENSKICGTKPIAQPCAEHSVSILSLL